MAEQNGSQQRPASSSNGYPSPQMQPAYTYPPQGGQTIETYRESPTNPNMPLQPLSLPPLRAMEGQGQPQGQHPQAQVGIPMVGHAMQYYPGPPHVMVHPGQAMHNMATAQLMRYPIPAQGGGDARMLSGGRHKKEIKRRTKSGCLTCRKRRIKCDEAKPVCRNCTKSKRECLGYDPIFKQQTGQAPHHPAQSASPSSTSSTPARNFLPNNNTTTSVPQSQVSTILSGAASGGIAHSSKSYQGAYELSAAIDPALAAADAASKVALQARAQPGSHIELQGKAIVKLSSGKMRPIAVEALFWENGKAPFDVLPDLESLSETALKDVNVLYTNDFAPGFDGLLDVKWYSTHGIDGVLKDQELCKLIITLIKYYEHVQQAQGDPETEFENQNRMKALECKVVWRLLCLVRVGSSDNANGESTTALHERTEVMGRLEIIETLLTNQTLLYNPLVNLNYDADIAPEKRKETEFWQLVGQYLTLPLNQDSSLWSVLMDIRDLLDGAENRDVIYSALVSRYFCDRIIGFPDNFQKNTLAGEEDPVNKAHIAKSFLKLQAEFQGTNHPIQRICHMIVTSWVYR